MRVKKRRHHSRIRGGKTCGWGFRQTHKGKGSKGGIGMSGTGKRSSQKQLKGLMIARKAGFETYFGKRGYTSGPTARKVNKVMNLDDIHKNFAGQAEIKLEKYKILGEGEGFKAKIIAQSASESALEKMKKAGGEIILPKEVEKKERKVQTKTEKASEKKPESKKAEVKAKK